MPSSFPLPVQTLTNFHIPDKHPLIFPGDSLQWIGDFPEAIRIYKELLTKDFLKTEEERYHVENQLVHAYLKTRQLGKATALHDSLGKKLKESRINLKNIQADIHLNEGLILWQSDGGKQAIPFLKKALKLYRQDYGNEHFKTLEALTELGLGYRFNTHESDSILILLQEAGEWAEKLPELPVITVRAYWAKALAGVLRREHFKSYIYTESAIRGMQDMPWVDTVFLARNLGLQGWLLLKLNQIESGQNTIDSALELLRGKAKYRGVFHRILQWRLVSFIYSEDSLGLENFIAKFRSHIAKPLSPFLDSNQVAVLQMLVNGEYNDHIVIEKYRNLLDKYGPTMDLALLDETFYSLSDSFEQIEQYDSAAHYVIRNLTLGSPYEYSGLDWEELFSNKLRIRSNQFVCYDQLASIYGNKYKNDPNDIDALNKALQLHQLMDTLLFADIGLLTNGAALQFLQEVGYGSFNNAVQLTYSKVQQSGQPTFLDNLHRYIERSKSFLLSKDLISIRNKQYPDVPAKMIYRDKSIDTALEALYSILVKNENLNKAELKKGRSLLVEQQALEKQFQQKYTNFYQDRVQQEVVDLTELQLKLGQNKVMLQYFVGEEYIYILAIRSDTVIVHQVQKPANLKNRILAFRESLASNEYDRRSNEILYLKYANEFYNLLIQPIEALIPDSSRVVIVPHLELDILPFGALLEQSFVAVDEVPIPYKKLPYWINKVSLSYAHSIRNYFNRLEHGFHISSKPTILAYAQKGADNNLTSSRRDNKSLDLPGSAQEVEYLENLFGQSGNTFCYGSESTKQHFEQNFEKGYEIVHFGLHASSDPNNRWNNKIIFNKERNPTGKESNFLYGFEVVSLQNYTKIGVLTACETAFGETIAGEGTFSLSRAFIQAGVPHVVSSLWSIYDLGTSAIVKLFYENLQKGFPPSEALRKAQLRYIHTSKVPDAHPVFWSSLVSYAL